MDKRRYEEMVSSLKGLEREKGIQGKKVYLFGHCHATEDLADLLLSKKYCPAAILDNNPNKHGNLYKGIPIVKPQTILSDGQENTVVCIAARAYAAMSRQLKRLGYRGLVRKMVDYNSYADYSLSGETVKRMKEREERGERLLAGLSGKYPGYFKILCPFQALGDICFMMSYLPYFLQRREVVKCVIGVVGNACGQVAELYCPEESGVVKAAGGFFRYAVEVFSQKDMDGMIQAALYVRDGNVFIPHQDRPYIVNLSKALYLKRIPLERIYCCGVFGLPPDTEPVKPTGFYEDVEAGDIRPGNAVILSPYAKSVAALPKGIWHDVVGHYRSLGLECYTNVAGNEEPLPGTRAISPQIRAMKSIVERAGIFVGIRSGMCDVLNTAEAKKIALYPDYNYSDTQWKAVDMYRLNGWENIVVKDGFKWKGN